MDRLGSVILPCVSQANAAALKPAHSFEDRLTDLAHRKLCKRDHFPEKDRIFRLVITLDADADQCH